VRDALKESEMVGLGQLAMRGKEYFAALKPYGKGLLLETLRYEEEVRKPDTYFAEISEEQADQDLLTVAQALIKRKTAPFDAAAFKDHYNTALRELVNEKIKGKAPKVETEDERPSGGNVIDLMAALKQSLESSGGAKSASSGKSASKSSAKSGGSKKSSSAKSSARSSKPAQKARKTA
jgi:DNA end-binding protein Ku